VLAGLTVFTNAEAPESVLLGAPWDLHLKGGSLAFGKRRVRRPGVATGRRGRRGQRRVMVEPAPTVNATTPSSAQCACASCHRRAPSDGVA